MTTKRHSAIEIENSVADKSDSKTSPHESIINSYNEVRAFSSTLAEPLETEDYVIQSMPDVSPTKWHLAHTSWFFETFVLSKVNPEYKSPNPQYAYLFNSYYVQAGERHLRPKRGLISRPTVNETFSYRNHVDESMIDFMENASEKELSDYASVIEIGIHHEQQHQELMLTDIKHVFSENPLRPAYIESKNKRHTIKHNIAPAEWIKFSEGLYTVGHQGNEFGYDNEFPTHKTYLNAFQIQSRLVTNGDYIEFIQAGGYQTPELWLSDGWATVDANNWTAPFYWEDMDGERWQFTLGGMRQVDPDEPISHLSYYEADAYARWAGARLPTEAEWEIAAGDLPREGNFVDNANFHPVSVNEKDVSEDFPVQMYGDVWEWTQSPYTSYPGYKPAKGALGEYNGKFMCNQFVLRGGSCATSKSHIRKTYRNFFPANARWQFMGLRLAKEV